MAGRAAAGGGAIPPRLDRRSLRIARARRPAVHRDDAYAPNSPYAASKAAARSSGAGVPSHLRAAGHHEQLLEQLRAVPVSREADPADAGERARRQAAAGVWRRAPTCATGCTSRTTAAPSSGCCCEGRPGETYNVGGRNEWTNIDIVRLLCRLVDEAFAERPELAAPIPRLSRRERRETASLVTFVADRPGHDRRYAIDAGKIERELGFRPRETSRPASGKTLRGTSTTSRGGAASWTAATGSGSGGTTPPRPPRESPR